MSKTGNDVIALTDLVTPAEAARLAALGIRVLAVHAVGAPPVGRLGAEALLVSDMGTAGTLSVEKTRGRVRVIVDPILQSQLESATRHLLGREIMHRVLPRSLTVEDYVFVFEKLAGWLGGLGSPREQMGSAWALHCILALPPVGTPRHVKHAARAVRTLVAAGVPVSLFYDTLHATHGKRVLERATEASIFRLAHPELHTSLILEMFA